MWPGNTPRNGPGGVATEPAERSGRKTARREILMINEEYISINMKNDQSGSEQRSAAAEREAPPRLADDSFYRALADRRRRRLLSVLLDQEQRTVEELATVITGWDTTDTGGMATPEDRDAVLTSLIHVHLPLLAAAGLIEYDRAQGRVQLESLEPAVDALITRSIEAEPTSTG